MAARAKILVAAATDNTTMQITMQEQGFTLIELILYIALVAVFITGAVFFAWDVVYGREKAYQQQVVEQSGRAAIARIAYEIRRAKSITSIADEQLVLANGNGSDTTVALSSGVIQITTGGAGPYDLTSNQVQITDLSFTDLTSTDNNTKDVNVRLTACQSSSVLSSQSLAQSTMNQSVELNSQFNEARRLLVDASEAALSSNNKRIEGATIQNTNDTDIVIEQMAVSWTGTDGDESLEEIQIDGGAIEWGGTRASSTDLFSLDNNYTLTTAAGGVDIDYLEFDKSMEDATVTLVFALSDSSTVEVEIALGASISCDDYCQQQYGLSGGCAKIQDCGGHNEGSIYECSPPNICCCE